MDQDTNKAVESNNKSTASNKQSNKKLIIIISIVGGVILVVALASSLLVWNFAKDKFGNEGVASNTVTGFIENATDGKVNIDANNGEVTIKGDSGESITNKSTLPDGFPSEVVIYSPGTIQGSLTSSQEGKTNWTVSIESTDPFNKVKPAITEQYSGWTKAAEFNSDTSTVLNYSNGTYNVVINIAESSNSDGKTEVVYSVSTE